MIDNRPRTSTYTVFEVNFDDKEGQTRSAKFKMKDDKGHGASVSLDGGEWLDVEYVQSVMDAFNDRFPEASGI